VYFLSGAGLIACKDVRIFEAFWYLSPPSPALLGRDKARSDQARFLIAPVEVGSRAGAPAVGRPTIEKVAYGATYDAKRPSEAL
jgi:hypothetical protein